MDDVQPIVRIHRDVVRDLPFVFLWQLRPVVLNSKLVYAIPDNILRR